MIEFKADCGHTVRAKDEDAGKVVRCAYCGREAQVPDDQPDDMDFLFAESGSASNDASTREPSARASKRSGMPFSRRARGTDPFAVVTKMAYVAVILIVVIFVWNKYAGPAFREAFFTDTSPTAKNPPLTTPTDSSARPTVTPSEPPKQYGLLNPRLDRRGKEGIFVNPVPSRARIYFREHDSAANEDDFEWLQRPTAARIEGPPYIQDLKPGMHEVVVAYPISDPQLKRYRPYGYSDTRRMIEDLVRNRDHSTQADAIAERYFKPDDSSATFVIRLGDPLNIIRRYVVMVRRDEWQVLTPLFLPDGCEMREIKQFLPKERAFGVNLNDLRDELRHYGVDEIDHGYIEDILVNIGSISYGFPMSKKRELEFRLLKINPATGIFTARVLEGKNRPIPSPPDGTDP